MAVIHGILTREERGSKEVNPKRLGVNAYGLEAPSWKKGQEMHGSLAERIDRKRERTETKRVDQLTARQQKKLAKRAKKR